MKLTFCIRMLTLLSLAGMATGAAQQTAAPAYPQPDERYKAHVLLVTAHPDDETAVGTLRAILREEVDPMKSVMITVLVLALPVVAARGQMLDPALDRDDEPFCYFSQPTDEIGVMDGAEGTMVTPEGYLCTGFGELMWFTGNPLVPVRQRVKTLLRGYLPVVQYHLEQEGVRYELMLFAATLDGNPESPLINFARVRIRNTASQPRSAYFGAGTRYQNDANTDWGIGDNRFSHPAKAKVLGEYEQAGAAFNPQWEYAFGDDAFLRDSLAMYMFPATAAPQRLMVLKTGYGEAPEVGAMRIPILPTTPVGVVMYKLALQPNEEQALDFKMPYAPLSPRSATFAQLRAASFDAYLDLTIKAWETIFARGIEIALPEEKVANTFKANLVYDLIARNKQDGQYDGWGQTMWAFGQHYRITRDRAFAELVYPAVQKAVAWLQQARRGDPLHVMPATTPGDNENLTGHVTGHNFWALAGLKNAIALAEGMGNLRDAEAFRREYADYRGALVKQLKKITATTAGYMPPGLDDLSGYDWGNMLSVYPEMILDPLDPMVTATLKATRARYQEGIMTYANGWYLHHYLTMKNTETEVIRGDQQMAIEELYALLLHTSATHAGFEFSIRPWGTRDFGMNLAPHGWFAAKFRALLRNMLVREQDRRLHLLSCLSPEWVHDGARLSVSRAPTNFGQVNFVLECKSAEAVLTLDNKFSERPGEIVVHLPWFMEVRDVLADGKKAVPVNSAVVLPADTRTVQFTWSRKGATPNLSYAQAVQDYKREYRRRYEEFLMKGN